MPEAFADIIQRMSAGDWRGVRASIESRYDRDGADPEMGYLLGLALNHENAYDQAKPLFRAAVEQLPHRSDIAYNCGVAAQQSGDLVQAIEFWRHCLIVDPNHVDAGFNLAKAFSQFGDAKSAEMAYLRVLDLDADHAPAHYNLGNLLFHQNRIPEARRHFQRAHECRPRWSLPLVNQGMVAKSMGLLEQAEGHYRQALALERDCVEARWNLAHLLLLTGRWQEGWAAYDWRLRRPQAKGPPVDRPAWDGRCLSDGALLIWAEQGYGDTIQFLRYVPSAVRRASKVYLRCQAPLAALIRQGAADFEVLDEDASLPDELAFQVPLLSLPLRLKMAHPADAWAGPYLFGPASKKMPTRKDRLHVGLAWAGNPCHENDANRSCGFEALRPLMTLPKICFYSLQVGDAAAQCTAFVHNGQVTDLGRHLNNFQATANAIQHLDLVICVDTAVAHLAGAMGRPVWMLLPWMPDWRWQIKGAQTDWYPSMRLFRQHRPGDWKEVVERIHQSLAAMTEQMDEAG